MISASSISRIMEMSTFADRKEWNLTMDRGLFYDEIELDADNIFYISFMTNVVISNEFPLPDINLPNLRILRMTYCYSVPLDLQLCPNLQQLDLGYMFNYLWELDLSTVNLTYLKIDGYNIKLDLSQQTNLQVLSIGCKYDYELDLQINVNLHTVNIANQFNSPIKLPNSSQLTKLTFGMLFNQELDLTHQVKLQHLKVGQNFNKPLNLRYNPNLRHLQTDLRFNQPLDLSTNLKLEYLKTDYYYNQPLNLEHNTSLTTLNMIHGKFNNKISLPSSLTKFYMSKYFNQELDLSNIRLKELFIGKRFNHKLDLSQQPLTHLTLGHRFNHPIVLKNTLIILRLNTDFNYPLDLSDYPNLEEVQVGDDYSYELALPTSLKKLHINSSRMKPVDLTNISLTELDLGNYNHPIDLTHQNNLTNLNLGFQFKSSIILPYDSKLNHLNLGMKFNCKLDLSRQFNLEHITSCDNEGYHRQREYLFNQVLDLKSNTKLTSIFLTNYQQPLDLQHNSKLNSIYLVFRYNYPIDVSHITSKIEISVDTTDSPIYVSPTDSASANNIKTAYKMVCKI